RMLCDGAPEPVAVAAPAAPASSTREYYGPPELVDAPETAVSPAPLTSEAQP
ncbi:dihydrolipoamide succinyltransferase, partial [Caulobacter sp. 17J65-9]|nr:dihydrolipoamide succinyltransferase [Caulobacter sp. 17J65-9]